MKTSTTVETIFSVHLTTEETQYLVDEWRKVRGQLGSDVPYMKELMEKLIGVYPY
ncbi:hypothetical protein SCRM01_204 [Synechococcus phage S-CRM01]|uniref:hypothetical protein n=1 Tax=Synechococcus phage S-CRM01 TaxID=1026955 RepID=UPI000209E41D|nr:hypothetical protein SCRM01_204 [Synechococcus phage S-CRM01]AEC53150.1 hypothetical protein SCRM01_204 [Synechococcus phage S-CRM01]